MGECKIRQGGEHHPALRRRHAHEVLVVVELDRDKTPLSINVCDGAVRRQAPERLLLDLGADSNVADPEASSIRHLSGRSAGALPTFAGGFF